MTEEELKKRERLIKKYFLKHKDRKYVVGDNDAYYTIDGFTYCKSDVRYRPWFEFNVTAHESIHYLGSRLNLEHLIYSDVRNRTRRYFGYNEDVMVSVTHKRNDWLPKLEPVHGARKNPDH
jgi:hypothetical protein